MYASKRFYRIASVCGCLLMAGIATSVGLRGQSAPSSTPHDASAPTRDVLTPQQWKDLERSVDRALVWLASQQREDGSYPTLEPARPGVTGLCVLAFLSRGHLPGEGRYGKVIDRGIAYLLACRQKDGLITEIYPSMPMGPRNPTHTAHYNHAIAGLCLSEAYGMTTGETSRRIRGVIESALKYTRVRQQIRKNKPGEQGGWRYARPKPSCDSDLSVTGWQMLFLRSARNAGFEVPDRWIDEALVFVHRCFDPRDHSFLYGLYGNDRHTSRAMTGAGILALSLGGRHHTRQAELAGRWLLRHPFDEYNTGRDKHDRYFYGAFYCSAAMFQLGGRYWADFYPATVRPMLAHQRRDGSWDAEAGKDEPFGNAYSTALAVLALATPYQVLPIFQR